MCVSQNKDRRCSVVDVGAALDLRALQAEFYGEMASIAQQELDKHFSSYLTAADIASLLGAIKPRIRKSLDETTKMDADLRMAKVASSCVDTMLAFISSQPSPTSDALLTIPRFRDSFAVRGAECLQSWRSTFLQGGRGVAPASQYLHKTRPIYEFVRITLGVKMHGIENFGQFAQGLGVQDATMGQNITRIYEVR